MITRLGLVGLALLGTVTCIRLQGHSELWPCRSASDCDSGEKCLESVCRPASYCVKASDCREPQSCRSGACVLDECNGSDDWACRPYACMGNGKCAKTCDPSSSGYCALGYECTAAHSCMPHASIEPCPGNFGRYIGQCRTSCSSADECVSGYACMASACVSPAAHPVDAGSDPKPAADAAADARPAADAAADAKPVRQDANAAGSLFSVCQSDSDCQSRACCPTSAARRCLVSCTSSLPIGAPCSSRADCASGLCGADSADLKGYCTEPCSVGLTDCGTNFWDPAGSANRCKTTLQGDRYCYAGCARDSSSCAVYGASLSCWLGYSDEFVCGGP